MRRIITVVFILALALEVSAQESYFPKGAFSDYSRVDLGRAEWYSKHLKALSEPSLLVLAKNPKLESYRFIWLRTFDHPVTVRLDIRADGLGNLSTKVASGTGGDEPGQIIENTSRPLTQEQTKIFLDRIKQTRFWNLPSYENSSGKDGSQWIVEGIKEGKYHVVDRWTPGKGPSENWVSRLRWNWQG
jgi:hypothetical protein